MWQRRRIIKVKKKVSIIKRSKTYLNNRIQAFSYMMKQCTLFVSSRCFRKILSKNRSSWLKVMSFLDSADDRARWKSDITRIKSESSKNIQRPSNIGSKVSRKNKAEPNMRISIKLKSDLTQAK